MGATPFQSPTGVSASAGTAASIAQTRAGIRVLIMIAALAIG
jgi:hypothetical protein